MLDHILLLLNIALNILIKTMVPSHLLLLAITVANSVILRQKLDRQRVLIFLAFRFSNSTGHLFLNGLELF